MLPIDAAHSWNPIDIFNVRHSSRGRSTALCICTTATNSHTTPSLLYFCFLYAQPYVQTPSTLWRRRSVDAALAQRCPVASLADACMYERTPSASDDGARHCTAVALLRPPCVGAGRCNSTAPRGGGVALVCLCACPLAHDALDDAVHHTRLLLSTVSASRWLRPSGGHDDAAYITHAHIRPSPAHSHGGNARMGCSQAHVLQPKRVLHP